jgi:N-acetylglutamate synthase-like GNAT family acetyltransferase
MLLWKIDLEITKDYILQNKVVKVFDAENFIGFFAVIADKENNAVIDHFWIKPEMIKQNYGREIFSYVTKYISSSGYKRLTLIAEPNTKGFYEKMGGEITGQFESLISKRYLDVYEFPIK